MAKNKTTVFYCQNCGYESSKWMGQCPGCKEWNTMVEEKAPAKSGAGGGAHRRESVIPTSLTAVDIQEEERMSTHMAELDRVLGGGILHTVYPEGIETVPKRFAINYRNK